MPYELSFTKPVLLLDRDEYINECCVGGDKVVDRLLPAVRRHYGEVDTNQEDWGWFIWIARGAATLAVDVYTDDPERGEFRVRLTSRTRRLLFLQSEADTPDLESLRALVTAELEAWVGAPVAVEHVDAD